MKVNSKIRKHRTFILIATDMLIIALAYMLSYFLLVNQQYFLNNTILINIAIAIIVDEILFFAFKLYKNITRFENGNDYLIYMIVIMIGCFALSTVTMILKLDFVVTKVNLLAGILIAVGIVSCRVIIRYILNLRIPEVIKERKNVLIIGAGYAGKDIIKTIKNNMHERYHIVGIIDDNRNKLNYVISGIKILGDRNQIVKICKEEKVDEIFFAISNLPNQNKKEILNICQNTGCRIRILPTTEDIIRNKDMFNNLRNVEIEDLLGRDPVILDNKNIKELIENKTILVTGGGGSIGSELCRQIAKFNPKQLVIFDIYENNLYDIELELKDNFKNIEIIAAVGSVRDKNKLDNLFDTYRPYLVFHAAAHKHVPLMENSPLEAIKNNVFGTYNVVNCADKYGVKRFILISTDKAVNPTNIMGATKRLCEMIIQAKNKVSQTEYVAVRFGNVLGSNGSVIPLFKKQIEHGGPVTVTHKEITRFFMTIPEATQLVIQAMTYAKGGEIFVLDMGEPVKIYDLAESLIRLSGFVPNEDIEIKVTGLRPGEKLYEELLMSEEGLQKTGHNKIFIGELMDIDILDLKEKLSKLDQLISNEEHTLDDVKGVMKEIVPTYHEPEIV